MKKLFQVNFESVFSLLWFLCSFPPWLFGLFLLVLQFCCRHCSAYQLLDGMCTLCLLIACCRGKSLFFFFFFICCLWTFCWLIDFSSAEYEWWNCCGLVLECYTEAQHDRAVGCYNITTRPVWVYWDKSYEYCSYNLKHFGLSWCHKLFMPFWTFPV